MKAVRLSIGVVLALAACGGEASYVETGEPFGEEFESSVEALTAASCPAGSEVCSGTSDALASCLLVIGEPKLRGEIAQTFRVTKVGYPGRIRLLLKRLYDLAPGATPEMRVEIRPVVDGKVPLDPNATIAVARFKLANLLRTDREAVANFTSLTPLRQLQPGVDYALVFRVPSPSVLTVGVGCHRTNTYPGGRAWSRRMQNLAGTFYSNPPFVEDDRDLSFSLSLDDGCVPGQVRTCGTGQCRNSVPTCIDGETNACAPGLPSAETCDNIDNDCDGFVDNAATSQLCSFSPNVSNTACNAGVCSIASCTSNFYNLDTNYANGCECQDAGSGGATCAGATNFGSIGVGGVSQMSGKVPLTSVSDWYLVTFAPGAAGPSGGTPRVFFSAGGSNHRFDIQAGCSGGASCAGGVSWGFIDDQAGAGVNQWTTRNVAWPTTVLVRVYRIDAAACDGYTLTVAR